MNNDVSDMQVSSAGFALSDDEGNAAETGGIAGIPEDFVAPGSEPLRLALPPADFTPGEQSFDGPSRKAPNPNGNKYYKIEMAGWDVEHMTPRAREAFNNNPIALAEAMERVAPENRASAMRQAYVGIQAAQRHLSPHPEVEAVIANAVEKTGHDPEYVRWLMNNDPEKLTAAITANEALRLSGAAGYVTRQLQNPDSAMSKTRDALAWADLEWNYVNLGYGSKAWHEIRGLAGSFVTMGTDIARAGGDLTMAASAFLDQTRLDYLNSLTPQKQEEYARKMSGGRWGADGFRRYYQSGVERAEENRLMLRDYNNYAKAWLEKRPVETDSWVYNNVVQPAMGVAPSLTAGLLTGGYGAYVIALSYGSGTYNRMVDSGVPAGGAAAMALVGGTVAYFGGNIGLRNIRSMLAPRSPWSIFGTEYLRGVAVGGVSNAVQSVGQTVPYALGRNLFRPEGSFQNFHSNVWADRMNWVGEAHGGAMYAFLSGVGGFPRAVRHQARSWAADRQQRAMGEKVAGMKLFRDGQDAVIAGEINNMGRHHGTGVYFASSSVLMQGGADRAEIVSQLGITEDALAYSEETGAEIPVPVGNAIVFTQRQKANGNAAYEGVFKTAPGDMTVAEIQAQANEVDAALKMAENRFADLTIGRSTPPPRIAAFRDGLVAAGSTTAGISKAEADAAASILWARSERAAEQRGETIDQYLERIDVQLEFDQALADAGKMVRYRRAMEKIRDNWARENGYAAPAAADAGDGAAMQPAGVVDGPAGAAVETAAQGGVENKEAPGGPWSGAENAQVAASNREPALATEKEIRRTGQMERVPGELWSGGRETSEAATGREPGFSILSKYFNVKSSGPILEQLHQDGVRADDAALQRDAAAAQDVTTLAQPVVGDADNQAWVDEATANIVDSFGLQGEEFAPLVREIMAALEQGINSPDIRKMAETLGVELPTAALETMDGARETTGEKPAKHTEQRFKASDDQLIVAEVRQKFEAAQTFAVSEGDFPVEFGPRFGSRLVEWARGLGIFGSYVNEDTGWGAIAVAPSSVRSVNGHNAAKGKLAVLRVVPDLIRSGIYLETTRRSEKHVSHIFAGKVTLDGTRYLVGFTVTEDNNGRKYYNHEMTEIENLGVIRPEGTVTRKKARGPEPNVRNEKTNKKAPGSIQVEDRAIREDSASREPIVSILARYLAVKPGEQYFALDELYQGSQPRGSIRFPHYAAAPTTINLFKNADISTVLHELNHLFIEDLRTLVDSGNAGDSARADWAALVDSTKGLLTSGNPDERRQAMELIAGNWERYLMTGSAPRVDLMAPFANIRKWMANIYRGITEQAGEMPSAEVAAVFDRMLATDSQIEAAELAVNDLGYWEDRVDAIQGESRDRIRKAREKVTAARRRKADAETSGPSALALAPAAIADEAAAVARTIPVYKAMGKVREAGGLDRDAVRASIGDTGVKAIVERHGEAVFGKGAAMEDVAAVNGFQSSDAMLGAMVAADPMDVIARRRISERLADAEEFRRLQEESEGRIEDDDAADPQAECIETEIEVGMEERERQDTSFDRSRGLREYNERRRTQRQAVLNRMMALPFEQAVDVRGMQSAKNAAGKLAFRAALRAGKAKTGADAGKHWAEFQRQKEIELLHHMEIQVAKTARKVRDWVKKSTTDGALEKKLQADRKHPRVYDDHAEALKDLAAFMGWTRAEKMRPATDSALLLLPKAGDENVSALIPDIASNIDPWLLMKVRPDGWRSWQDFTLGQVIEAQRVFTKLLEQGRGVLHALGNERAENLQKLVLESIAPMERRPDRAKQQDDRKKNGVLRNWWNKFLIRVTIPETWFQMMDGNPTIQGKDSGINHDLFYRIRNCEVVREEMKVKLREMGQPHFDALKAEVDRMEKENGGKFWSDAELPVFENLRQAREYDTWTGEMFISMALNMGNDANLYALMEGYGISEAMLAKIQSKLSTAGWEAVQGIWDMVDSLAPQLDALSYRMTNRHMTKEPPRAFTVTASDGEVRLRGGYYPLVFDPLLSERGARSQASIEDALFSNQKAAAFRSAMPQDGMLNARLRDDEGRPVVKYPPLLKLDVLAQHLDMTTHLLSHAETLSEFDRLTRDPVWKGTYIDKFGQDQWNALRKWVQDLARPGKLDNEPGMEFLLMLRGMATVNGLGLRPTTSAKQRLGPFQAYTLMNDASSTGANSLFYLMNGLRAIGIGGNVGSKTQMMKEIDGKSGYMRIRDGSQDRDLRALKDSISLLNDEMRIPVLNLKLNRKWLHDQMFFMIKAMDRASAYSVWYASYQQAIQGDANFSTEGLSDTQLEEKAVKYADLITASQSSSFRADLTEKQRSGGLGHFMTMFMSGNVRQAGRLMQYLDASRLGDKSKLDILSFMLQEHMYPAAAWVLTRAGLLALLGIYDPDDESIAAELAWNTLGNATAAFPYIREVSSLVQYNSGGQVPALDALSRNYQNAKRGAKAISNAEYDKAAVNFGDAAGYASRIPIMNLYRDVRPLLQAAGVVEGNKP